MRYCDSLTILSPSRLTSRKHMKRFASISALTLVLAVTCFAQQSVEGEWVGGSNLFGDQVFIPRRRWTGWGLVVGAFIASALWAVRSTQMDGTTPPPIPPKEEGHRDSKQDDKNRNGNSASTFQGLTVLRRRGRRYLSFHAP